MIQLTRLLVFYVAVRAVGNSESWQGAARLVAFSSVYSCLQTRPVPSFRIALRCTTLLAHFLVQRASLCLRHKLPYPWRRCSAFRRKSRCDFALSSPLLRMASERGFFYTPQLVRGVDARLVRTLTCSLICGHDLCLVWATSWWLCSRSSQSVRKAGQ